LKTVTVVDTFAFFFRAYFALPPLKSPSGFPTGLLTGFVNFVHQLQREHMTDYIVFALDSKEGSFRKELYPEYKANRPAPPEDLVAQLSVAIEWIEKMGFKTLTKSRYEADDVIATVMKFAKEQGIVGKMVSSDKDLYQLIYDKQIFLYDWVKRKNIGIEECVAKFGVKPEDFVDFQALLGDSSDNVPGVKGIGVKTASKMINEFHTLEAIYENIEKVGTKRIQNLLLEYKEEAFISRELVKLRDDIFTSCPLDEYTFEDKNYLIALKDEFEKYGMNQAIRYASSEKESAKPSVAEEKKEQISFEAITLDSKEKIAEVLNTIEDNAIVAFDTETTSLDTKSAKLVGFSFAVDEQKAYYVPVAHSYLGVGEQLGLEDAKWAIEQILKFRVVGQNLKFDFGLLWHYLDLEVKELFADTMIMAWLLEPGSRIGLDALAKKFFNYEMISFKSSVKKGENFSSVTIEEATKYAAEDAWMTLKLYNKLMEMYKLGGLEELLEEAKSVEYPFLLTLMHIESYGIKIDTQYLKEFSEHLSEELQHLSQRIYDLAGGEFNIRSTQQLGQILFGKLALKGGKKTKTGYSTNESVLQSLRGEHEIIDDILEYRQYQKILSTYAKPLLKLALKDSEHRIYTTFVQTGTATGRLASKDPNLQNIPVKSELGRRVRRAFVAKEGYSLVSIDYSQIELRLLAHFSGDRSLREAFLEDKDIHLETAIKLFGEEEAQKKRNFAKSINFGLLYGMGSRKLSQELGITASEAKEIIANYFAAFPTVKSYLESIQERVKQQGYVKTLLKRRRVFDYEGANAMTKAAILREAVNTVFQGSAADLIKLAMLDIERAIEEEGLDAKILLQIHDELIFEVEESKAQELADRFAYMMENIYPLEVKLKSSVSVAKSWDKLK
jgi:DNA polymerase-1